MPGIRDGGAVEETATWNSPNRGHCCYYSDDRHYLVGSRGLQRTPFRAVSRMMSFAFCRRRVEGLGKLVADAKRTFAST